MVHWDIPVSGRRQKIDRGAGAVVRAWPRTAPHIVRHPATADPVYRTAAFIAGARPIQSAREPHPREEVRIEHLRVLQEAVLDIYTSSAMDCQRRKSAGAALVVRPPVSTEQCCCGSTRFQVLDVLRELLQDRRWPAWHPSAVHRYPAAQGVPAPERNIASSLSAAEPDTTKTFVTGVAALKWAG